MNTIKYIDSINIGGDHYMFHVVWRDGHKLDVYGTDDLYCIVRDNWLKRFNKTVYINHFTTRWK